MFDLIVLTGFVLLMAQCQAICEQNLANRSYATRIKKDYRHIDDFFYLAMGVLLLLTVLRGVNIGNDTAAYHHIFINSITNPNYIFETRFEKGYILLNQFVGLFTDNSQWMIAISAIITYSGYLFIIRKYSLNKAVSLILFFILSYGTIMNIIRQQLAMVFIFIAFDRVLNKKTLQAYIWIIIAMLFHKSALIAIVVPILPYIKFNKGLAITGVIIALIFAFTDILYDVCLVIAPSYAHYFGGKYEGTGTLAITYQLMRNIAFFFIVYNVIIKKKRSVLNIEEGKLSVEKTNNLVLWIMYIVAAGIIMGYKINIVDRVLGYFTSFAVLLAPNALTKYEKNSREWLTFILLSLLIAYSLIVQIFRPEWNTIFPYSFCWS